MDLDEWEILPHGGFLDYHESGGGDHSGNKKGLASTKYSSNQRTMFDMNYFGCPSSSPPTNSRIVHNQQLVPVPFQLGPPTSVKNGEDQEKVAPTTINNNIKKPSLGIKIVKPSSVIIVPKEIKSLDDDVVSKQETSNDQDPITQVFFKKLRENKTKFVDMKIDSPESPTKGFISPPSPPRQIEAGKLDFDDKSEDSEMKISSLRIKNEKEDEEVNWEENNLGLNLWKWSLNGIGAICSFGVAAATVCIIILGSQQKNKHQQQKQKMRFQFYSDDKRIKQVVHHTTRLNEAITTVRGVPIARAHVTYGGYYEGL